MSLLPMPSPFCPPAPALSLAPLTLPRALLCDVPFPLHLHSHLSLTSTLTLPPPFPHLRSRCRGTRAPNTAQH